MKQIFLQNALEKLQDWFMKDILNRRSALHWFNLLETFSSHKTSKRLCRFCGNFPRYIQNPVWNNPLNQPGPHCPALRFAWPGRRGRPLGSLLWLHHLLSWVSTAQPPSRFTEAPAVSCHLETHSHPLKLAKFLFCPKLHFQQADKENPSLSTGAGSDLQHYQGNTEGMHYRGKSHSENVSKSAPICTSVFCILQVKWEWKKQPQNRKLILLSNSVVIKLWFQCLHKCCDTILYIVRARQ